MELLQLKYFCHAAKTENFSQTAKAYFVPPSNISQSIKRLETELSTPLFIRSGNRVKLNSQGKKFYEKVQFSLNILENAASELLKKTYTETISMNIQVNRQAAMKAIETFKKDHENLHFLATHKPAEDLNDFDIIITDQLLDVPYFRTELSTEALELAYNRNFFSFFVPVDLSQLQQTPFILMNSESRLYENAMEVCRAIGIAPKIALESEDPFYIRKCIELGLGVSIIPKFSWKNQFSPDIQYLNLGDFKRTTYLYIRNGENTLVEEFVSVLRKAFTA